METHLCPVCRDLLGTPATQVGTILKVLCPRCGAFTCTGTAVTLLLDEAEQSEDEKRRLGPWHSRRRANASAYVRENPGIRIATQDVEWLASLNLPSFHQRADKLLQAIERKTEYAGEPVNVDAQKWSAIAWCIDQEFGEVLKYLVSTRRVQPTHANAPSPVAIAPDGWAHLETLRERGAATSQGFIAMHMVESLDSLWHRGLEAGIKTAGYSAFRIDRKLDADKLDDEILAEIRRSKFLVADLTNQRPSVYLEVGFAMGLGMRVFRTCREDDIQNLHFDQKTYHCTSWVQGKEDELAKSLRGRIVARFGEGPLKSSE